MRVLPVTRWNLPLAVLLAVLAGCNAPPAAGALAPPAPDPEPADAVRLDHRDPGDTTTPLPEAISRALQTDELVLTCPGGVVDGRSHFARDWVGVHRVDLDGDGREEWILNGLHPCLRQQADDNAWWWIYSGDAAGSQRVLLRARQARQLEVLPTRHNGMADLRAHLVNGRGQALRSDFASDGERYVAAARVEP
ncbi:hypothetical protein LY625_03585 [Lysobacter sp. GX 14042]|uniref:hypothetical protein n=1 Tax=Lysobacter sp. GX 14042 TaxID=2907155 RepID=UPI001F2BABC5|nr:hypothetical protein [Lysobacter sp. GX 14042]MCE7031706.1 hypothetical protein [Lysobacter sp. GX 14042]